ncbi:MAG: ABC transporter ATP-binding protein [bacterium]|nr:ABC transporter ATP-binding protein [bacterium]
MNKLIEIINLKKHFKSGAQTLKVLDDLNFSVQKGEIIAVTGESGVGKSTLLSLIGGLDSVTAGEIRIREKDITRLGETELTQFRGDYIGFVFQNHFLLNEFTAYENILIPHLIRKRKLTRDTDRYILGLLDMVRLRERKDHKPGELSGGECQRIALLRALMNRPEIVIADEPTGNLDEKNSMLIFDLMRTLNRKFKVTFIIATHNQAVRKYSDDIYVLKQGKIFRKA